MRNSLARWISDADALRHLEHFRTREIPLSLGPLHARADDYYMSLVGELFDRMRDDYVETTDWARLGNALVQFAERDAESLVRLGINAAEARLFASTAFYIGGYWESRDQLRIHWRRESTEEMTE